MSRGQASKQGVHSLLRRWSKCNIPSARQIDLSESLIAVLPSKMGVVFLVLIVLMFVLALNFQNVPIQMLAFFLISLFLVSASHTHRHLSKLQLIAVPASPCFVGDTLKLQVRLRNPLGEGRYQIKFRRQVAQMIDLESTAEKQVILDYPARHRGVCQPENIRISTRYPLGLLESWTWVDLVYNALVYPKPITEPFRYIAAGCDRISMNQRIQKGLDDFKGFRTYQPGDNLNQIAWKQSARGGGLLTKEFEDQIEHTHWLDWDAVDHGDTEYRLSVLCGWVLMSHQLNYRYGLRLPGQAIEPARGDAHRDRCLKILGFYDLHGVTRSKNASVKGDS